MSLRGFVQGLLLFTVFYSSGIIAMDREARERSLKESPPAIARAIRVIQAMDNQGFGRLSPLARHGRINQALMDIRQSFAKIQARGELVDGLIEVFSSLSEILAGVVRAQEINRSINKMSFAQTIDFMAMAHKVGVVVRLATEVCIEVHRLATFLSLFGQVDGIQALCAKRLSDQALQEVCRLGKRALKIFKRAVKKVAIDGDESYGAEMFIVRSIDQAQRRAYFEGARDLWDSMDFN